MGTLYQWLFFVHIVSVGGFLFVHGISGGTSFLLRGPVSGTTRAVLQMSRVSGQASYPFLLLIIITGVWMTFAGHWNGQFWPWAALVILILAMGFMGFIARPYYLAREAAGGPDDALATKLAVGRPQLAAGVGVLALLLLFILMVFKPF